MAENAHILKGLAVYGAGNLYTFPLMARASPLRQTVAPFKPVAIGTGTRRGAAGNHSPLTFSALDSKFVPSAAHGPHGARRRGLGMAIGRVESGAPARRIGRIPGSLTGAARCPTWSGCGAVSSTSARKHKENWMDRYGMSRHDRWLAEAELEQLVADDRAETAARAKTGDLNSDGSWSTTIRSAPPPAPSAALPSVALGGLASGLGGAAGRFLGGLVFNALFGGRKRRAPRVEVVEDENAEWEMHEQSQEKVRVLKDQVRHLQDQARYSDAKIAQWEAYERLCKRYERWLRAKVETDDAVSFEDWLLREDRAEVLAKTSAQALLAQE